MFGLSFLTLVHVSPFVSLCFFTTLAATRRCRCLLRSVWVNVMPERLLSVISGILAGGIPGFRIELCCFYHPLIWPLCMVLCFLFFDFISVAILITQDVIMHVFLIAGSDPTSLCFLWVLVLLLLCVFWFAWLLLFLVCVFCLFSCWDCSLDCVQVHYQHFCGYRQVDSLA